MPSKGSILQTVREFLNDIHPPYLWSEAELDAYYSSTSLDFSARSELFFQTFTISVTTPNYIFDLPSELLRVHHARFDSLYLNKVPFIRIKDRLNEKGQTEYYCVDYLPQKILLFRKPQANGTLSIYGPISSVLQEVPPLYTDAFIYGILSKAFQKADSETISPYAEKYFTLYLAEVERLKVRERRKDYHIFNVTPVYRGLF